MIARLIALLSHRHGQFDRYAHLEKGTIFVSLAQKWKTQIRWILAIAMAITSLILFIIYLDFGPSHISLYVPLIPAIIVCILIIEATLISDGVTSEDLMIYIIFGAICALISLILLSLKWSHTGNITKGWYIIHLPIFFLLFGLIYFNCSMFAG